MAEEYERYTWLREEINNWQEEGIISGDQARTIKAKYQTVPVSKTHNLITVLTIAGSVLLGLGVILFFAANWATISKSIKLLTIFGSIIGVYGVGYYLAYEKKSYVKLGQSLILLGSLLYGAGIWLTAQIFHISAHYPNGFLLWAVGILPIAYLCRSLPILVLSSGLIAAWNFMEQIDFMRMNILYIPFAAMILFLAYKFRNSLVVGITTLATILWAMLATVLFANPNYYSGSFAYFIMCVHLVGILGILTYSIGRVHSGSKFDLFQSVYGYLGIIAFMIPLFLGTFKALNQGMETDNFIVNLHPLVTTFFLAVAVIIIILTVLKKRMNHQNSDLSKGRFIPLIAVLLSLSIHFAAPYLGSMWYTAIENIYMFIAIFVLISAGYHQSDTGLINLGLLFFVIEIIARYFDFFWNMMDRSLFFIVGGIILLAGGTFLERKRRKLLTELQVKQYEK